MGKKLKHEIRRLVMFVTCPTCGSVKDYPCTTIHDGRELSKPHYARSNEARRYYIENILMRVKSE